VFWLKSELFLTKIWTLISKKLFRSGGQKERGLGEEGIFARPRFRRFFFRRRNFSYFALRNAPPRKKKLCLPHPPLRAQQIYSLYYHNLFWVIQQ